jgi:hypothetical protein
MGELARRSIHSYFIAYLHLRELAMAQGSLTNLRPQWSSLAPSLAISGGPPDKPYFLPFGSPQRGSSHWMNENLAGSWAPSSTREGQPPRRVIQAAQGRGLVNLREGHVQLALEHLLGGEPVSAISWAVWWLRDYGFTQTPPERQPFLVVHAFREMFRFYEEGEAANDFSELFVMEPRLRLSDWFEPGPEGPAS